MTIFGYILGTCLVAFVVFLTAFYAIKKFLENDQRKLILELKHNAKNAMNPLRIQAYERLALFLERIEPNQLILRLNSLDLTAEQFKALMLATLRSEWDHNLSQQIYVSSGLWDHIVQTKEETVKLINLSAGKLNEESTGLELATVILEQVAHNKPNQRAMTTLKEEVALLF
jgi:hypothetical protein